MASTEVWVDQPSPTEVFTTVRLILARRLDTDEKSMTHVAYDVVLYATPIWLCFARPLVAPPLWIPSIVPFVTATEYKALLASMPPANSGPKLARLFVPPAPPPVDSKSIEAALTDPTMREEAYAGLLGMVRRELALEEHAHAIPLEWIDLLITAWTGDPPVSKCLLCRVCDIVPQSRAAIQWLHVYFRRVSKSDYATAWNLCSACTNRIDTSFCRVTSQRLLFTLDITLLAAWKPLYYLRDREESLLSFCCDYLHRSAWKATIAALEMSSENAKSLITDRLADLVAQTHPLDDERDRLLSDCVTRHHIPLSAIKCSACEHKGCKYRPGALATDAVHELDKILTKRVAAEKAEDQNQEWVVLKLAPTYYGPFSRENLAFISQHIEFVNCPTNVQRLWLALAGFSAEMTQPVLAWTEQSRPPVHEPSVWAHILNSAQRSTRTSPHHFTKLVTSERWKRAAFAGFRELSVTCTVPLCQEVEFLNWATYDVRLIRRSAWLERHLGAQMVTQAASKGAAELLRYWRSLKFTPSVFKDLFLSPADVYGLLRAAFQNGVGPEFVGAFRLNDSSSPFVAAVRACARNGSWFEHSFRLGQVLAFREEPSSNKKMRLQ